MADGPEAITPAQREVIQGALAGSQDAGLKIAGMAEVTEVAPTLVGPADAPTDLGPTVELSVTVDADGRPIPRGDARDPGVVGDSVMTIRVTPHADHGGTFWRANVSVHDVETSRLYHGQSSGATPEQYEQIVGDRTDAEYAEDPEVAEQLLELEAQSPAEAVEHALAGIAGGGVVDTHKPWDTPAAAPAAASGGPPWLLVGGGVALLLALVVVIGMFTGGTGDEVPVADADTPSTSATAGDDADGATGEDAGLPPRPEGADQGTLTVAGDDTCGYFGTLGEWSGRAEPSGEGGRLVVSTGSFGPEEISGRLWPDGAGGLVWEDREFLSGEPDSQLLDDITIEEGIITGALAWTDHDGCSSIGTLTLEIPVDVTYWLGALPTPGSSDCVLVEPELSLDPGDDSMYVLGRIEDAASGDPAPNQLLHIQVAGKPGLLAELTVTTSEAGYFSVQLPDGIDLDDSSLSASVLKGPHRLGTVFLE